MIYGKTFGLIAILSTFLLSSCAMYKTMPEQPSNQPEVQSEIQPIETHDLQGNELENQSGYSSETSIDSNADHSIPQSKVKLSIKDNRLIAKLYTDWNDAQQGDLKLHWIAPKNSHCISTVFPIMKYKESSDYSWAYRTLDYTNKGQALYCSGLWTVEVIYKPTQQIVGKASLNVLDSHSR